MPGVKVVRDGDFVGVVAPTEQSRRSARRDQGRVADDRQPSAKDSVQVSERAPEQRPWRRWLRRRGGGGNQGSIEDGLKAADKTLEATYTIAYIAHCPLEPRAAVAEWADGKLTVWTGTQMPFRVRGEVANAVGVAADKVRVIVPDMGSGYGGKHTGECGGRSGAAGQGGRQAGQARLDARRRVHLGLLPPGRRDRGQRRRQSRRHAHRLGIPQLQLGRVGDSTPYDVPNRKQEFHSTESPLKQGSYRALASTANHFARESHMDDLAHAVGMDPLEFRLKNLKDAAAAGGARSGREAVRLGQHEAGSRTAASASPCGTEKGQLRRHLRRSRRSIQRRRRSVSSGRSRRSSAARFSTPIT